MAHTILVEFADPTPESSLVLNKGKLAIRSHNGIKDASPKDAVWWLIDRNQQWAEGTGQLNWSANGMHQL